MNVLVTGAGGFIGGHLVASLREKGAGRIRAVDIKPAGEWYQRFDDVENLTLDLRDASACRQAAAGVDWIYNLAADMGGMGFIELHKAECMLSVLINTNLLWRRGMPAASAISTPPRLASMRPISRPRRRIPG